MSRRNRYKERNRIWPWVSFIVFGAILSLLGYSIVKKVSPVEAMKTIFSGGEDKDSIYSASKKELIVMVKERDVRITTLEEELSILKSNNGFKRGVITTSSNTLNMREAATLSSSVIVKIPNGSTVSILYYDDQQLFLDGAMGQWCRIRYADQEGWVWGNYVAVQEE